jgi:LuxR family maltose regulon positive regulatory protein
VDRLDSFGVNTIVLLAPAGYGKSTLARQYVRRRERKAIWYHCTKASSDVATLASALAMKVTSATGISLASVQEHLRASLKPQQEGSVAADMFGEALENWPDDAVLVIDDYEHLAGEIAAEDFLERLLFDGTVRSIVASRLRPAWLTARRITYGEVVEIDARELAMTDDEATAVFHAVGVPAAIDRAALADGWPAAITLIALGGENVHAVSGALEDFVAHEVYRSFDPRTRQQLAVLASFGTISVEAASLIFGNEAVMALQSARDHRVLEQVAGGSYELHPLVRDFLRSQPVDEDTRQAAESAGEALVSENRWDELFDLADRLKSEVLLGRLLTSGVRVALDEGRVASVRRWLDYARLHRMNSALVTLGEAELALRDGYFAQSESLAAEVVDELEALPSAQTWALLVAGRAAHLSGREERAVNYYRLARGSAQDDTERREAEWGEVNAAIDLELPDAADLLQRLRESERATATDRVEVASRALILGARLGSLTALEEARSVLQLVDLLTDPVARASFRNTYAYACALAGEYDDAIATLDALESEARVQRLQFALPYVACARAVVHVAMRQFEQAFEALSGATIDARRKSDVHIVGMCAAIKSRGLIALGRFSEAAFVASYRHPALIRSMHGELLATQALALVGDGNDGPASELLDEARDLTAAVEVLGLASCIRAITLARTNDEHSDAAVREAACYARDSRYVDGLIAAYRAFPDLARRIASLDEHADWFVALMLRAQDEELARVAGAGRRGSARHLTRREAEVFALLREGLSNKEIGVRLFITEDTAKRHVHRIMSKLGARSRTEAALRTPPMS